MNSGDHENALTYIQYVSSLKAQDSQLQWLERFLTIYPVDRNVADENFATRVLIIDSINGELNNISCSNSIALEATLKTTDHDLHTRIIVLSYVDPWNISRNALGQLAYSLDLDPTFLCEHFDRPGTHLWDPDKFESGTRDKLGPQFTSPLPSDRKFLQIDLGDRRLSAVIVGGQSTFTTILILVADETHQHAPMFLRQPVSVHTFKAPDTVQNLGYSSWPNDTTLYCRSLTSWHPDDVHSADDNPTLFIYPFIKIFLSRTATEVGVLQRHAKAATDPHHGILQDAYVTGTQVDIKKVLSISEDIESSLESLASFESGDYYWGRSTLSLSTGKARIISESIKYDYNSLLKRSKDLSRQLEGFLSRQVSLYALEESRKSIQLADSVKTISILAFVFVPMTFATSLFGMNMSVFGSGSLYLWQYVVAAVIVSGITLGAWYFFKWQAQRPPRGSEDRLHFIGWKKRTRILGSMLILSPWSTLWLVMYMLFHGREESGKAFKDLELLTLHRLAQKTRRGHDDTSNLAQFEKIPGKTAYIRFWQRRLRSVARTTSVRGWQTDYCYKRWFRILCSWRKPPSGINAVEAPV